MTVLHELVRRYARWVLRDELERERRRSADAREDYERSMTRTMQNCLKMMRQVTAQKKRLRDSRDCWEKKAKCFEAECKRHREGR